MIKLLHSDGWDTLGGQSLTADICTFPHFTYDVRMMFVLIHASAMTPKVRENHELVTIVIPQFFKKNPMTRYLSLQRCMYVYCMVSSTLP